MIGCDKIFQEIVRLRAWERRRASLWFCSYKVNIIRHVTTLIILTIANQSYFMVSICIVSRDSTAVSGIYDQNFVRIYGQEFRGWGWRSSPIPATTRWRQASALFMIDVIQSDIELRNYQEEEKYLLLFFTISLRDDGLVGLLRFVQPERCQTWSYLTNNF